MGRSGEPPPTRRHQRTTGRAHRDLRVCNDGLAAAAAGPSKPPILGYPTVFTGEYRHSVDDKGRLAVPSRFRAQLDGGLVVSRWIDGCLAIHTRAGWAALAEKVAALPLTDAAARLFNRSVFAGADETDLDRQGRVLLPAFLREGIELAGDAVVIGARDHAEIWVPAAWAEYRLAMDDAGAFARAIQGLGI